MLGAVKISVVQAEVALNSPHSCAALKEFEAQLRVVKSIQTYPPYGSEEAVCIQKE